MTGQSRIIGTDLVRQKLVKISRDNRKDTAAGLGLAVKLYETELKRAIQEGSRTGKVYEFRAALKDKKEKPETYRVINGNKVGLIKRDKPHQASAPGESPKADMGGLVKSINGEVDTSTLNAKVASNLKYALWLEVGTKNMKPRPVWEPVLKEQAKPITRLIGKGVELTIQKNEK